MKLVRSRDNAAYKSLLRLATSARARREERRTLLDGPHLIAAFHASGGEFEQLVASETGHGRNEVRRLFEATPARARMLLADGLFDEVAQVATPTGILGVIGTPQPPALPARLDRALLLDGIQDPGNLGSILRTAVAAGIQHVLLSKGSVFAWSPKVLRAGQGAHFFLSIHEHVALDAVAARTEGRAIATDPRAETSVFDADLLGRTAWIFGAEGGGISAALAAHADLRVRIPMPGPVESLNVAAAVAVCLFEQVRQRAQPR